ncbi:MFS transporter [Crateriforma conspicua]|uniref:MFS transporter n=1 Tax=Crateriforma TaxID=2714592 RepID=UPI0011B5A4F7|nr:MFS transporter [Crateriforma conspicua]
MSFKSIAGSPLWRLWSVVIAGEAIFVLPFVLPRLFRPVMLAQWGISNTELGLAFSAYGIVAAMAYFAGGPLADRFGPRVMMTLALLSTAACGLALWGQPSATRLLWTYAAFGITTILLFWAPMIRATHDLARTQTQGRAFGILDAGRGLFAALLASLLSFVFASLVDDGGEADAFEAILLLAILSVAASGALVWLGLNQPTTARCETTNFGQNAATPGHSINVQAIGRVLRRRSVWLQGWIVLCAYCGYKSIDNYGIYVVDAYDASSSRAAWVTTLAFWARPIAALSAGLVADRAGRMGWLAVLFAVVAMGNGWLAIDHRPTNGPVAVTLSATPVLLTLLGCTAAAIYGLRGVYFAVFDDLRIPPTLVGTAAGLVSLVGFLPDIFFGPVTGWVIDQYPGITGHRMVFAGIAVMSVMGVAASLWQRRDVRQATNSLDQTSA